MFSYNTCDILCRGNVILLLKSAARKTTMKERGMMSQQQKLIQLPLVSMLLLCLLAGVYLFASKRFSKRESSASIEKHSLDTSSAEALKYWTADKMRKAKPVDLPNVKVPEQGKRQPRRPRD